MVIYIDGVPYNHMWGFDKTISNISRVEVLRGPQGAIYGKDSMGGVINIVTKEPSDIVEGSVKAEYGTDNYQEAAFNISGPLINNKLYLGVNGVYSQSDGWVTNHYPGSRGDHANEEERYLVNAKLIYKPTDDLSIKLNASEESNTRYGREGVTIPSDADINSYERDDFKYSLYDQETYRENKSDAQALHIDYDFNGMTFSSLTTHKKTEPCAYYDSDGSYGTAKDGYHYFMEFETKNIAQEFRLSNNSDRLRWVTGLYYENEENDIIVAMRTVWNYDAISENISDTMAAFGQLIVPLLEDYELTLGGRYQRIKKDFDLESYLLPAGTTGAPYFTLNEDKTWNTFLPKIALAYKINGDLSSYFSITRGYLAGGFNYNASAEVKNSFDAQKSTNYEIGIRGDLLDNRLYLSAALFYMDIEDLHVWSTDSETGARTTSNAAEAYSQGIEIELGYSINDNWSVNGSLGLIEAKYDNYIDADGTDLSENRIQDTPSHTANIGISYLNPNGFYGRLNIRSQGKVYFDKTDTLYENSYITADIRAGYLFDAWELYGYVNNITDESYLTAASETGITFGEGRFIGVGAKYLF
jgi:iron complex outermembrane receptor protein